MRSALSRALRDFIARSVAFGYHLGTTSVAVRKGRLRTRALAPGRRFTRIPRENARLSSRDDERIDDQGLDRGLRQNLWHANIGVAAGGHVDKHHVGGIFGAGSADVQLTNCFDGNSCEQEPVRYFKSS